jgi:hypothetical protein
MTNHLSLALSKGLTMFLTRSALVYMRRRGRCDRHPQGSVSRGVARRTLTNEGESWHAHRVAKPRGDEVEPFCHPLK